MEPNRKFSEEYRGPSGWWSAVKTYAAYTLSASTASSILMFKSETFLNWIDRKDPKLYKVSALIFALPLIPAVRSYFTASVAQTDHEAAVATVKDLTVENAKLKADSAYQTRFAEREQVRRGEAAEHVITR